MAQATSSSDPFELLRQDVTDYCYSTEVERVHCPSPLEFYRDFVCPNKPCIITGVTNKWPVFRGSQHPQPEQATPSLQPAKWTNAYLRQELGDTAVSVDFTPDGRFDAPVGKHFVVPHEQKLPFSSFMDIVEGKAKDTHLPVGVAAVQHQNGNFSSEFAGGLAQDVPNHIEFATAAFGSRPDAVNIWMGCCNHSVSSMHKDPYENLYAVVAGVKHFVLMPPTEVCRVRYQNYTLAHYEYDRTSRTYSVVPEQPEQSVPWIPWDVPLVNAATAAFTAACTSYGAKPSQAAAMPKDHHVLRVSVRPGELLYLPAMWFHCVQQTCDKAGRTIAVNYWYDMSFDIRYCYYQFLKRLQPAPAHGGDDEKTHDGTAAGGHATAATDT